MAEKWSGKGDAGSALRRQWLELKYLADARTGRTVADLRNHLREAGYDPSKRTVERDLTDLREVFPLKCVGRQPQTWFFDRKERLLVPSLTPHEALSFALVEQRLGALLPGTTRDHLGGHFANARQVLAGEDGRRMARWTERVVAIPRAQPLVPARVAAEVRDAVYDALLRGRRLEVRYRAREGRPRAHLLHPLGLAVRETVTYLVAVVDGFADPRIFALHRASSAKVIEQPATWPDGFDLRRYVEQEAHWPFSDEKIALELRVAAGVVIAFEETPLAGDQRVEPDGDGFRVRASVLDTRLLRSFLLGYGSRIEVLAPKHLRETLAAEAEAMRALYAAPPRRRAPAKPGAR